MKSLMKKSLMLICMSFFMSSVFAGDATTMQDNEGGKPAMTKHTHKKAKKGCHCKAKKHEHKHHHHKKGNTQHSEEHHENSTEQ